MNTHELLTRIEEANTKATAPNRDLTEVGPFLLMLSPSTPMPWVNNAAWVDKSTTLKRADIDAMVEAFRANERTPRMELFSGIHGDLIQLLQEAGFVVESEMPLMLCTPETFRPQPLAGARLERVGPDGDVETVIRVVDTAFEHEEPTTPERIEAQRRSLSKGTIRTALCYLDGQPAAVASMVVAEGVGELAGVGTLPEFRRRGAASAVSTFLLEEFFASASLAWLSAGDDTARAVYERLGFELLGTQVNISLPGAESA